MRVDLFLNEYFIFHFVTEFVKTHEFEDGDKKVLTTLILTLSIFLDRVSFYTVACRLFNV